MAGGILDQTPFPVAGFVIGDLPLAVRPIGNNGPRSLLAEGIAKCVRVVAFVGNEVVCVLHAFQKQLSGPNITNISRG